MYDWDNSGGQKNRGGVRRSQTGVWSSDYECPKSARKNRSGDVDAIFCASRGVRVVGGRYYLRPGAAGYAERGLGRCVQGRGYCWAAAREETWRPSEEDSRKLTGG
jgi:hypothetical protein